MCGRFLFLLDQELLKMLDEAQDRLDAEGIPYAVKSGEIAPADLVPILVPKGGALAAYPACWGFTNDLRRENAQRAREGKKPLKPKAVFNTRSETAGSSAFWRDSFHRRRCLIPTCGFYEWQRTGAAKAEYRFSLPGQPVTMVAGIWRTERDERIGRDMIHFSMLTTPPSDSVRDVHDRMPVVLLPSEYNQWLRGDCQSLLDRRNIRLDKQPVSEDGDEDSEPVF